MWHTYTIPLTTEPKYFINTCTFWLCSLQVQSFSLNGRVFVAGTKTGRAEVGEEGKAPGLLRRGVAHTEATTHGVCVAGGWLSAEPKGGDAHTAPREGGMQLVQNVCFNKSPQKVLRSGKTAVGLMGAGDAPVSGVHVSCKKEGKNGEQRSETINRRFRYWHQQHFWGEPSGGLGGRSSENSSLHQACAITCQQLKGDPERVGGWLGGGPSPCGCPLVGREPGGCCHHCACQATRLVSGEIPAWWWGSTWGLWVVLMRRWVTNKWGRSLCLQEPDLPAPLRSQLCAVPVSPVSLGWVSPVCTLFSSARPWEVWGEAEDAQYQRDVRKHVTVLFGSWILSHTLFLLCLSPPFTPISTASGVALFSLQA